MTALQRIVKEAKRMRKVHPNKYAKWTDYVKAASKAIKKPGKKVADVNVTYRSAKKDADYIVERRQNGTFKGMMRVAGTKAKPKPATHTDKGSHNVKIKVVSGTPNMNQFWSERLKICIKQIEYYEKAIEEDRINAKKSLTAIARNAYKKIVASKMRNLKILKKELALIKSAIK